MNLRFAIHLPFAFLSLVSGRLVIPQCWWREFQAVSRRIAEVDRLTSRFPFNISLDLDIRFS
jgi:hypothetical protein